MGFSQQEYWILNRWATCNAEDTGDAGWISGLGRSPLEEEMATHSTILARKIPWTMVQRLTEVDPWIGKIPCRREWLPTPIELPENPTDRGAWQATVHGATRLSNCHFHLNIQVDIFWKEKESWRQERILQTIFYCWTSGQCSPFTLCPDALYCFNSGLLMFLLPLRTFSLLMVCYRNFTWNKMLLLFSRWIWVFIIE